MPGIDQLLTQLPDGVTVKPRLLPGSLCKSQQHSAITQPIVSDESSDITPDSEASLILDSILADSGMVAAQGVPMHDEDTGSSSSGLQLASTSSTDQSHDQISPDNMDAFSSFQSSYDIVGYEMNNESAFSFPVSGWLGPRSPGAFMRSLQFSGTLFTF